MDRTRSPLDRLSDDVVLCLFSRAPFTTHGQLQVVCRRLRTLVRSREFLQQRVGSGLVEHGLVVAGGWRDGGRITAGCSAFTCGRWRPIAPMSSPRAHACSAIVEDEDGQPEMWVMGGWDVGGHYLATVEAYNPRTNTWRSCLPLSQRRECAVAGVVGGRLVVAGGWDGGYVVGNLLSVEAYTPTGWTPLPPLPHAANQATACVLNGRLYVMGGFYRKKLQVLEMSEDNEFSWTVKADLPAARWGAASAVVDGKLWLMGGELLPVDEDDDEEDEDEDEEVSTDTVVVYDPAEDSWEAGPTLPHEVSECIATVHDGKVYLLSWEGAALEILVYRDGAWEQGTAENRDCDVAACDSILLG